MGVGVLSLEIVLHYVIYFPLVLLTLDPFQIVFHLIVGHWLLANVTFNYYKCLTTPPGHPPNDSRSAKQIIGVCKRCIAPKPPRAHHCSVCKKCKQATVPPSGANLLIGPHLQVFWRWITTAPGSTTVWVTSTTDSSFPSSSISSWELSTSLQLPNSTSSSASNPLKSNLTAYFESREKLEEVLFEQVLRMFRGREAIYRDWYHSAVSIECGIALVSIVPVGFIFLQQLKLLIFGETVIEQYTNIKERQRCKDKNIVSFIFLTRFLQISFGWLIIVEISQYIRLRFQI